MNSLDSENKHIGVEETQNIGLIDSGNLNQTKKRTKDNQNFEFETKANLNTKKRNISKKKTCKENCVNLSNLQTLNLNCLNAINENLISKNAQKKGEINFLTNEQIQLIDFDGTENREWFKRKGQLVFLRFSS